MAESRLRPVYLATVDPHPAAWTGLGLEAPACGDGLSDGATTLAAARHARDGWGLHLLILSLRDRATYGRRAMILDGRPVCPGARGTLQPGGKGSVNGRVRWTKV